MGRFQARTVLIMLVVGVTGTAGLLVATAPGQRTLTVFAAASLTDAFEEIGAAFEAEHPGVDVLYSFAGSSTLAAQLTEGAPADVFASANDRQMGVAQDGGRIGSAPQTFARNALVIITPIENPAGLADLHDLAQPGLLLVLAAPEVPVRAYTDALLEALAADPAYGEAYRAAVLGNVASEEANVRQVALKVALGEADAGVVYASDVTPDLAAAVQVIAVPAPYNVTATYPIAITDAPADPALARAFVEYVLSPAGQEILVGRGFLPAQ